MQRNSCSEDNILLQDCLQTFPENVKVVIIKIPKTNSYLEYLLQQLRAVVSDDTIYCGGR